jgi:hypothetical protein
VFIEASGCDEAADIALEDFKSEPQPDDVVEDGCPESQGRQTDDDRVSKHDGSYNVH